ncbi:esterase/lipase family protein [Lentzea tibetensis]|uniref:esterase/lipase family protein n=1 Tax=Lentzea tibetensis TaxID=2591470 RepID=UPI001C99C09E|nr:hypothetical protein [Lentzea tibetensis]
MPHGWRLSNRYHGEPLVKILEQQQDKKLYHSMGGLVARWYVEKCGGAERTRKLITFGTPYRGAATAVARLVNGVRRKIGPLTVALTEFARSMPSLHQVDAHDRWRAAAHLHDGAHRR